MISQKDLYSEDFLTRINKIKQDLKSGQKAKAIQDLHGIKDSLITDNEKGTGIGMRIVRDFVALHNGKLAIESQPNNGTTVTVYLPL